MQTPRVDDSLYLLVREGEIMTAKFCQCTILASKPQLKNKRISKILLEHEEKKWYLRKLGLCRFQCASAVVSDLNDSQLGPRWSPFPPECPKYVLCSVSQHLRLPGEVPGLPQNTLL